MSRQPWFDFLPKFQPEVSALILQNNRQDSRLKETFKTEAKIKKRENSFD